MFQKWGVSAKDVLCLEGAPLPDAPICGHPARHFMIQSYPARDWVLIVRAFHFAQQTNPSPHCAKVYGLILDGKRCSLILARPHQTLESFLVKPRFDGMSETIARQLVTLAGTLRELSIMHRSICAKKIWLFYDTHKRDVLVQLAPFDYGCYALGPSSFVPLPCAIPGQDIHYESDYLLHQRQKSRTTGFYDESIDQFAIGMLLFRLINRYPFYPADCLKPVDMRRHLHKELRVSHQRQQQQQWYSFVTSSLAPNQNLENTSKEVTIQQSPLVNIEILNVLDEKARDPWHFLQATQLWSRLTENKIDKLQEKLSELVLWCTSPECHPTKDKNLDKDEIKLIFAILPCLVQPFDTKLVREVQTGISLMERDKGYEPDRTLLRLLFFLLCQKEEASSQLLLQDYKNITFRRTSDLFLLPMLTPETRRILATRYAGAMCKMILAGKQKRPYDAVHQLKKTFLL